jgi:hypothetical protein
MSQAASEGAGRRRERSARYPGATLDEAIELARLMSERGVDGLPAEAIAAAMGYKNIRTHWLSARLSAARQFGLIKLVDDGYALTDLARLLIHPVSAAAEASARRRAFREPPLYAELCEKFAGKRLPEGAALGNWLYHNHEITAAAKDPAAETFLASAREAGVLGADGILRPEVVEGEAPTVARSTHDPRPATAVQLRSTTGQVEFTLKLWGRDEGKEIRVSAPESLGSGSYERLLQALRLHVRIVDDERTTGGR